MNKILLFWNKGNTIKALIYRIWYSEITEGNKLEIIGDDEYLEIEESSLPYREMNGKMAELYINPETKELWYEYKDLPIDETEQLKQRVTELELLMAEQMM